MSAIFTKNISDLAKTLASITQEGMAAADIAIDKTATALKSGKKIMACGNGGSAATVSHIVNDLVCHMKNWNRKGYRVLSLCDSTAVLTSLTNDYGFETVFAKQVEAFGEKGDVLWAFSSSGNSKNVVEAIHIAKALGIFCVAFTGKKGGAMKDIADVWVGVPSDEVMRVEELHMIYAHCVSESVEAIVSPMEADA